MTALQTLLAQNSGFQFSWMSFFVVLFVIVSVLMILIVLMQRPQGGGLSGAFGASSDGAGQTAFGAKTGDALTLATVTIFILFLGFAVALNYTMRPDDGQVIPTADGVDEEESGAAGTTTPANAPEGLRMVTPEELEALQQAGTLPGGSPSTTTDDAPTEDAAPETPDDADAPSDG